MTSQRSTTVLEILLCFLLFGFLAVTEFLRWQNWDFDDALIVYRVVDNLREGIGWRFNPSENVNASTSVLNTLIVYSVSLLTQNSQSAAHILGALFSFASAILGFLLFRRSSNLVVSLGLASSVLYFSTSSFVWGIETQLFLFLLLLYVFLKTHQKTSWPILSLLILTRPDALLLLVFDFLVTSRKNFKKALKEAIFSVSLLLPWMIFSAFQFGQISPGTLSAKMWQGESGLWGHGPLFLKGLIKHTFALEGGMTVLPAWLPALSVPGFFLLIKFNPYLFYISVFALAQVGAYTVLNVPPYHWYFSSFDLASILQAAVTLAVVSNLTLKRLVFLENHKRTLTLLGVGVFTLFLFYFVPINLKESRLDPRNEAYKKTIPVLGKHEVNSLAVLEVGTLGYYGNFHIVDLVSLTSENPELVTGLHKEWFFENPSDAVVLHSPPWHFERALYDDIRFPLIYDKVIHTNDPHFPMSVFFRNRDVDLSEENLQKVLERELGSLEPVKDPFASISGNALCALDLINGGLAVEPTRSLPAQWLKLSGWFQSDNEEREDSSLSAVLVGKTQNKSFRFPLERSPRTDVNAHLAFEGKTALGFEGRVNLQLAPAGLYNLTFISEGPAGTFICKPGKSLELSE